jgi:hypothetical protein
MRNKPSFSILAAVYLVIAQLDSFAVPLNILPDTLDVTTRTINIEDSLVFIKNNSVDTIIIDSIAVTESKTKSKQVQLELGLMTGNALRSYYAGYSAAHGWSTLSFNGFRILPNQTAYVDHTNIEICRICPTKTSAASDVGDTVTVTLLFYSGGNKDSLVMIGVQKLASSVEKKGVIPNRELDKSTHYDLNGKTENQKRRFFRTLIIKH